MMLQSSVTSKHLVSRLGIVFLKVRPEAAPTREMTTGFFTVVGIFEMKKQGIVFCRGLAKSCRKRD